ncbi:MAG TPA: cation-translocating P-type ATPase C-terminal domain-containing protein, partial [Membranihabitans sp.]|nr:cation-translocating P-type ATPase C-terminal domain-containing protein [Membranihabitans sp.]
TNVGEVVVMVTAISLGLPAPLHATQLLWINLITDTLPAVALGMDPGDPDIMDQPPRNPGEGFFAQGALLRILTGGLLIGTLTLGGYWLGYFTHGYRPFDGEIPQEVQRYARSMAFMTIVSCQLFYALSFRHQIRSLFSIGIFSNKYLIWAIVLGFGLQLLVMGIPILQNAFRLEMLDATSWAYVLGLGLIPLILSEVIKGFERFRNKKKSAFV